VRLLLDEMLSPSIAEELRSRGHDVEAVAGHPRREGLPDPEIMSLARSEGRAIVTNNVRDFRPLHYEAVTPGGPGHYGMVFMPGNYRRTKADAGRIVAALEAILIQFPGDDDLANGETWLSAPG
jgi:predicted nuclease of predicted toxin-antitoxin system